LLSDCLDSDDERVVRELRSEIEFSGVIVEHTPFVLIVQNGSG